MGRYDGKGIVVSIAAGPYVKWGADLVSILVALRPRSVWNPEQSDRLYKAEPEADDSCWCV